MSSAGVLERRYQSANDDALPTIRLARTLLPGFDPILDISQATAWWSFKLPTPPNADYQFWVGGEIKGDRQIGASLTDAQRDRSRDRFWYSALEMPDFRNDSAKLEEIFLQQIEAVLRFRTRIIENKGIFLLGYKGEYESNDGWKRLRGGVRYLGLGFRIPFIGMTRVYKSPPVLNWIVQR